MKIILPLFLFLFLSIGYCSGPQEIVDKIFAIASKPTLKSDKKLQEEIEMMIDFEKMADTTLGIYKSKISKDELVWYQNTIKKIITKTVYPKAYEFLNKVKISYLPSKKDESKAHINSIVKNRAQETDVTYFLEKKSKWKVVDIALDDESWVEGIKLDVQAIIKKDGFQALKKKLQTRLDELNSGK